MKNNWATQAAELGIISGLLTGKDLWGICDQYEITSNSFVSDDYRAIFNELARRHANGETFDYLSIATTFADAPGPVSMALADALINEGLSSIPHVFEGYCEAIYRHSAKLHNTRIIQDLKTAIGLGDNLVDVISKFRPYDPPGKRVDLASFGVEVQTFSQLFKYEAKDDTTTLLGNRWVCQGGQLLLVGQSGIGKSSITVQAALMWALGEPFMGINPSRPLKSLFVQAENDEGDMAEIVQGVMSYVLATAIKSRKFTKEQAFDMMTKNITFARVTSQTGAQFVNVLGKILDQHGQKDLVFVDPLLSYIGDDINQQKVVSNFLRNICNPIAFQRKFAWVFSHHTGKPASDVKSRKHWNEGDFAYIGLGSSELTNWARAIAVLQSTAHDGIYKLLLSKRGRRAGVVDENKQPTTVIPLKHADHGIYWEPCELPEDDDDKKRGRPKAITVLQEAELIAFASSWPDGKRGLYSAAAEKIGVHRDTVKKFLTASKINENESR